MDRDRKSYFWKYNQTEKARASSRKYRQSNPEKVKESQRKYHAKPAYHKKVRDNRLLWKKLGIQILGGKCACCGITEWWNLTIDHIVPLNGKKRPVFTTLYRAVCHGKTGNLQVLCFGCNASKNRHKRCMFDHSI